MKSYNSIKCTYHQFPYAAPYLLKAPGFESRRRNALKATILPIKISCRQLA